MTVASASTMTRLLALLLPLICVGCQPQIQQETESLPVKVPDPEVDISGYQLPDSMGQLRLVGDAMRERGEGRLFLYHASQPGDEARVILYPMAGGWDSLPPERVVAGQYGIIREQVLGRLTRQGYGTIEGTGEGLYQSETLGYPIAEVMLKSKSRASKPALLVWLGVAPPVFVRIERSVPAEQAAAAAEETRLWLEKLLQSLSASSQASNSGTLTNDNSVETITDAATCSGACP